MSDELPNPRMVGVDISGVIECAAQLVDSGVEVSEEYRRGVIELAARLCLCEDDFDAMVEVMAFAVCGVNRPETTTPPCTAGGCDAGTCKRGEVPCP